MCSKLNHWAFFFHNSPADLQSQEYQVGQVGQGHPRNRAPNYGKISTSAKYSQYFAYNKWIINPPFLRLFLALPCLLCALCDPIQNIVKAKITVICVYFFRQNEQDIFQRQKQERTLLGAVFTLNPGIPGAPAGPGGHMAGHCRGQRQSSERSLYAVGMLLSEICDSDLPKGHRSNHGEYQEGPDREE